MPKSITVSVRLTEDDAAFLAQLSIPSAITPSEKLRALISDARRRHDANLGFETHLSAMLETLRPLEQKLRALESDSGQHSELATGFPGWLAEAFAFAQSASAAIQQDKLDPKTFEHGVANRVFRLLEWVSRMGVTRHAPCYDPALVGDRFRPLRELVALLHQRLNEEIKELIDTLKARVGRIVAGSVAALVSSIEDAAPEVVLEQAIREVESSLDEARAELGRSLASRHMAAKQLAEKNVQHDKLSESLAFAVEQNRDDLAEAAIAAQLDIEAQIPVIESAIAGAAEDEREFSGYVAALDAKRREMEAEIKAYREREANARGNAAGAPGGVADAGRKANRAEQAFARVLSRGSFPAGLSGADAKTAAQLAELDQLMRRNRIQERLAQMKSGKKA